MTRRTRLRRILPILALLVAAPALGQSPHDLYQQALRKERAANDLAGAIELYRAVADAEDRMLAAQALIRMGAAYERLGRQEAETAYERVIQEFPDQAGPAAEARSRLAALSAARAPAAPAPPRDQLRLRRVWQDPGVDMEGQPSPDGRYLTFVNWNNGRIAVRDLETGESRDITPSGYPEYGGPSAFSPDGQRVAYFWTPGDMPWRPQLRVIGLDGTGEKVLIDNADVTIGWLNVSEWTGDGRVLTTIEDFDGTSRIQLTDASTARTEEVYVRENGGGFRATISPDARWIVFDMFTGPDRKRDLFVVPATGGEPTALVAHPADDRNPIFTPDGGHVAFTSDRGGTMDLWAVAFESGKASADPVLLKRNLAVGAHPMAFTADGALFYGRDTGGGDVYAADLDPRTLQTGTPRLVVQWDQGYNMAGAWSPDHRTLAYTSRRGARSLGHVTELFVADLETAEVRKVDGARFRRGWTRLYVSPDGRFVAGNGAHDDFGGGIYLFDLDTDDLRVIGMPRAPVRPFIAGWTPDARALYYTHFAAAADPRVELGRLDVASGEYRTLRDLGADIERGLARLSPDGTRMAYVVTGENGEELRISRLDGRDDRLLVSVRRPEDISQNGGLEWSADGRHVFYVHSVGETVDRNKTHRLFAAPITGGPPIDTGLALEELRHITILPGGTGIGFTAGPSSQEEVWVLENALAALDEH